MDAEPAEHVTRRMPSAAGAPGVDIPDLVEIPKQDIVPCRVVYVFVNVLPNRNQAVVRAEVDALIDPPLREERKPNLRVGGVTM